MSTSPRIVAQALSAVHLVSECVRTPPRKGAITERSVIVVPQFRNPYHRSDFRATCANGLDPRCVSFLLEDPRAEAVLSTVELIATSAIKGDGDAYTTIAIADDFDGMWIAPGLVQAAVDRLIANTTFTLSVYHCYLPGGVYYNEPAK